MVQLCKKSQKPCFHVADILEPVCLDETEREVKSSVINILHDRCLAHIYMARSNRQLETHTCYIQREAVGQYINIK